MARQTPFCAVSLMRSKSGYEVLPMEGEPAVGRPAGQVGVDDHHRRRRINATVCRACGRVQHPSALAPRCRCATSGEIDVRDLVRFYLDNPDLAASE